MYSKRFEESRESLLKKERHCQWPSCRVEKSLHCHHQIPRKISNNDFESNLIILCNVHHRKTENHYTKYKKLPIELRLGKGL